MAEDKKSISMLLVGESMAGKSEFILSFINSKDRERIPASGKGQTTRTSMIYSIDCISKKSLAIKLLLKGREQFCIERITSFWEKFDYDNRDNARKQRGFKHALIENDAFFHHKEFRCSKKISEKYDCLFSDEFYRVMKKDDQEYVVSKQIFKNFYELKQANKELDKDCDDVNIEECIRLFIEWVFEQCKEEIVKFLTEQLPDYKLDVNSYIDISTINNIECFLKTQDGEISYSSFVDKIFIETSIADYYAEMMNDVRISKIQFIDTYGLDHDKATAPELIKKRYHKLFKDFPSIENVIYIRRAIDGPPSDLSQNVPLLYSVKPSVMSYVCFTHADMLNNDANKAKAVKAMRDADSSVYDEVNDKLLDAGVNDKMAELRIVSMAKNIVIYCSKIGIDDKYNEYKESNIKQIKQMLRYIRDKKHLGDLLIDINKMSIENIGKIIDVSSIFSTYEDFKCNRYPGRTMGALGDRLQSGILGFHSSTWDYFKYWDDEIYALVYNRFFNITKLYKWADYLENENVVPVIQSLFNEFMDISIRCLRNPEKYFTNMPIGDDCQHCRHKDECIQNVIYEAKKTVINQKYKPVSLWLTEVYNFNSLLGDDIIRYKLQTIFNRLYQEKFITLCRDNNARVLASELNMDMTESEIDEHIQHYFSEIDSNLDEEEKIEFEQKVNQFFQ